jgi:hypothetical protein
MSILGRLLSGACLLALAGCGGSEPTQSGNAAAAETEAAGADGGGGAEVRLQPGQWEMKVEVKNAGLPNMPAGVADAMKTVSTTTTACLSEEDAAKPAIFSGKTDESCKSEGFEYQGGRVSGTITCGGADGDGKMTIRTEGTFSPTGFQTTSRSEIEGPGMKMTTESSVVGRRIGECPADADPGAREDNMGKKRIGG